MKINLVIEHIGGLGSKQQRKRANWGKKFAGKLKCPEFNQINGKVQNDKRDFES